MISKVKILLTGGSGLLGQKMIGLLSNLRNIEFIAPSHSELDLTKPDACQIIKIFNPHIFINLAAYTNVSRAETNKADCFKVNVEGLINLVKYISENGIKLFKFVHFSTDYVFDGLRGNYKEEDPVNPINVYGMSKAIGERITKSLNGHLIIRTSFKSRNKWPYEKAFVDLFSSADFVDCLAPEFLKAILHSKVFGTYHIAGKPKTIYKLARETRSNVGRMSIREVESIVRLPQNVTLDCTKWVNFKKKFITY